MGQYALILSLTDTVTSLSDLGIGQTALRYASLSASQGDSKGQMAVLRWAARLRLLLVTVMIIVLFFFAPILANRIWHIEELTRLIRIGLVTSIFAALASIPVIYYQSLKRFGMNAVVRSAQAVLSFAAIGLLWLFGMWSVFSVVVAVAIAMAVGTTVFTALIPREALVPNRFPKRPVSIGRLWKVPDSAREGIQMEGSNANQFAIDLLVSTVIVMITLKVDVWLMGVYLDEAEIGIYNVALRFSLPLTLVIGALTTALWPRASAATSGIEIRRLLGRTFKASGLVALGGVFYAIGAPMLAPFLFGKEYGNSVILAQIISMGYCVAILANPAGVVGYSMGMARIYWKVNLIQFIVVVVLLFLLLPKFGVLAAAWIFVLSTILGSSIIGTILWRKLRVLPAE